MIVEKNVSLSEKTTMKIGGSAELFYIPENEDDLIRIARELYEKHGKIYLLSGGSNLLINDEKSYEAVIYMRSACSELRSFGDGTFYIGASNRIQKVISFVNDCEYGGFEELIGLPAFFGGIIYMNAGIGGAENALFTISDFIETVRVYDLSEKKILELPKEDCLFSHRYSLFHNNKYIILGARIRCLPIRTEDAKNKKDTRLQFCKKNFEYGSGCFGTCFSTANYRILKAVSIFEKARKSGGKTIKFAKNNCNWLVNNGNGTYRDAVRIIRTCEMLHRLLFRKISCEVIIWD